MLNYALLILNKLTTFAFGAVQCTFPFNFPVNNNAVYPDGRMKNPLTSSVVPLQSSLEHHGSSSTAVNIGTISDFQTHSEVSILFLLPLNSTFGSGAFSMSIATGLLPGGGRNGVSARVSST